LKNHLIDAAKENLLVLKKANRSVDLPVLPHITVDPWVEPDADWAIADPYFCLLVMGKYVSFWPTSGVKYHVPWTEVDQKKMRLAFENVIPTYLDECGVLNAKCTSLETYKIKFEVADNVPTQGDAYGNCGVWVCIFLHRLCQNLPVSTDYAP
nr:ulp1 protease family, C-terminal catalytic domain-containing protein [Tanacetum cinerariifolium]